MEASALHAPAGIGRLRATGSLLRLRSDDQLVALFRMGYDDAFRVIHDRYRQRLLAYARQMLGGSRSDAEDAMQDVFLRAYGALRNDDRPVTLRAWLYRVAHNRCIDQVRRPIPAPADVFDVSRTPLRDPMAEAERREDLRRLVADVRRLPDQQRSALLMRELEGLSYHEVADALNVTLPAVKSLLVRARIGLVSAGEARDTACAEIRCDLAGAHDRGVRASGRARRHLRECTGCRDYRQSLRGVAHGLGALSPSAGPWAMVAKLLGIGGAGSGAAGGGAAVLGGGAAATATKVAAIVCCAAVVGGGAVEVRERVRAGPGPTPAVSAGGRGGAASMPVDTGAGTHAELPAPAAGAAKTPASSPAAAVVAEAAPSAALSEEGGTLVPHDESAAIREQEARTGGVAAPAEAPDLAAEPAPTTSETTQPAPRDGATTVTSTPPAPTETAEAPAAAGTTPQP